MIRRYLLPAFLHCLGIAFGLGLGMTMGIFVGITSVLAAFWNA